MSKFEINRMKLIRAILRFRSSFLAPMSKENNIWILKPAQYENMIGWISGYFFNKSISVQVNAVQKDAVNLSNTKWRKVVKFLGVS